MPGLFNDRIFEQIIELSFGYKSILSLLNLGNLMILGIMV